jgi:hypothetical protein
MLLTRKWLRYSGTIVASCASKLRDRRWLRQRQQPLQPKVSNSRLQKRIQKNVTRLDVAMNVLLLRAVLVNVCEAVGYSSRYSDPNLPCQRRPLSVTWKHQTKPLKSWLQMQNVEVVKITSVTCLPWRAVSKLPLERYS